MILEKTPDRINESVFLTVKDINAENGCRRIEREFRIHAVRVYNQISVKRMGKQGMIRFDVRNLKIVTKTGVWSREYSYIATELAKKHRSYLFPNCDE